MILANHAWKGRAPSDNLAAEPWHCIDIDNFNTFIIIINYFIELELRVAESPTHKRQKSSSAGASNLEVESILFLNC